MILCPEDDSNVHVRIWVCTNKVGSKSSTTIAVPRCEWEEMDDAERDEYLREEMLTLIEWNYETDQH